MNQKQSILKTEIKFPFDANSLRRSELIINWLSTIAISCFLFAPLLMAILAIIHQSIDYTVLTYPRIIQSYIFPIATVATVLGIFLYFVNMYSRKERLVDFFRKNPVIIIFIFLSIWMIISQTVNGWNHYASYGAIIREETIWMQLSYFLILFPAGALLRDEKQKMWIVRSFLLISWVLVFAAFILWHSQTVSLISYDWTPRFSSIFTNTNYYGYYLSIVIPASAVMFTLEKKWYWKVIAGVTLIINSVALSIDATMGAYVACIFALVAALVAYSVFKRKFCWQLFLSIILFIAAMVVTDFLTKENGFLRNIVELFLDLKTIAISPEDADGAGSGRWRIWKAVISYIVKRPVFGYGMEGIYAYDLAKAVHNTRPHNEYLQYAMFYGIPAGIAYVAGCAGVYIRAIKQRLNITPMTFVCLIGAFGYLISAFFGNTIFSTAAFLFIFLGMGYTHSSPDTNLL